MDTVLLGVAFVAAFGYWWVKRADLSGNDGASDARARSAPTDVVARLGRGFRPDIEGLRAVAVLLVLLYHAQLRPFMGGFIGVDVFFVLSGFLITSLLLRELSATGTVSLANFWARRARRLLPASGLVIVATLLFGRAILDGLSQMELARDAIAACAFVVNIRFAAIDTDYLRSQLPPSPLLHFWSLAVEEQFYLIWPWLLMLLVRVLGMGRRVLGSAVGAMWLASFIACIWFTTRSQPQAFFLLPMRAWELLTGAGLALAGGTLVALPRPQRVLLGWAGLVAIVFCGVRFDDAMKFPGWIAVIPVAATVLIVCAGGTGVAVGPTRLLAARPLQWLGARSYAVYLWHFPMLVLADRQWGPLSATTRICILVASVVVAAVSYRLVENPVRHSASLAAVPARSLAMGAWVVLIGIGVSLLVLNNPPPLDAGVEAAAPALVAAPSSTTAPTLAAGQPGTSIVDSFAVPVAPNVEPATTVVVPPADASHDNPPELAAMVAANRPLLDEAVQTVLVPSNLSPGLLAARDDLPHVYSNGCILDLGESQPRTCIYGDAAGSTTIVLFGDSHAAQWLPALHLVASQHGWRVIVYAKKACPSAEIPTAKDPTGSECGNWRAAVTQQIEALHPALVVMSGYRYDPAGAAIGQNPDTVWQDGLDRTLAKVRPLTGDVLLLGDSATPFSDVPSCLAEDVTNAQRCMNSREGAVRPGRLAVERSLAQKYDAHFVPTSDWMCTDTYCPVIVGNVLMYRDNSHITETASLLLAPYLDAALRTALG